MAEKKKKKFSLREFLSRIYDLVAKEISWQAIGILLIILFFIFTTSNKVTRIETQLEPLVTANLLTAIAKIDLKVENIRSFSIFCSGGSIFS
ncbi:unnamed protein product [marine sediment metagenome]|uniref:Uncharacterized protein n=1 Tax=marine sediment metagenome TaxID=412755 RepID=X0ZTE8_9ZZZZ